MSFSQSSQVKRHPYRYRVKYDSREEDGWPYWVEYNGGWRTLWCWFVLDYSQSRTLEQAMHTIKVHRKSYAKASENIKIVHTE